MCFAESPEVEDARAHALTALSGRRDGDGGAGYWVPGDRTSGFVRSTEPLGDKLGDVLEVLHKEAHPVEDHVARAVAMPPVEPAQPGIPREMMVAKETWVQGYNEARPYGNQHLVAMEPPFEHRVVVKAEGPADGCPCCAVTRPVAMQSPRDPLYQDNTVTPSGQVVTASRDPDLKACYDRDMDLLDRPLVIDEGASGLVKTEPVPPLPLVRKPASQPLTPPPSPEGT